MEKYLTEKEINILLSEPMENKKKILIQLGLESGARVSEIVGILARNVDGNFIKLYDYKKNDWRAIVISDNLRDKIIDYLSNTTAPKRGPRKMYPVSEKTINNWLKDIFNNAGLPSSKAHWHTFRHTFVSRCRLLGYDIAYAVAQTGDSPATILRYYGTPTLDERLNIIREKPILGGLDGMDRDKTGQERI